MGSIPVRVTNKKEIPFRYLFFCYLTAGASPCPTINNEQDWDFRDVGDGVPYKFNYELRITNYELNLLLLLLRG